MRVVRKAWLLCLMCGHLLACGGGDANTTRAAPSGNNADDAAGSGGANAPEVGQFTGDTNAPMGMAMAGTAAAMMPTMPVVDDMPMLDNGPAAQPAPMAFVPKADLDPNVQFDWPATVPGEGGCEPGTYTGTFMCELVATAESGLPLPPDGTAIVVSGPITLVFERSMDGEFLELADARMEGVAQDIIGFTSGLEGRLECAGQTFSAVASGEYGLGLPIGIPLGAFNGTMDGTLDSSTQVLSGEWALTGDWAAGLQECAGPWMATLSP